MKQEIVKLHEDKNKYEMAAKVDQYTVSFAMPVSLG